MRLQATRERWCALLELGISKPATLGFIDVRSGLRGLAEDLETSASTLSRNLRQWESSPTTLVRLGHQKRDRGRPELVVIQIPLLTEWLLWVAEAKAEFVVRPWGTLGFQQIRQVVAAQASLGLPPPSSARVGKEEARRLLGH